MPGLSLSAPLVRAASAGRIESEANYAVFRTKLDGAKFKVEVDDGEDVLVKKKGRQPDFDLKLVSNSVEAVRILLDRE